MDDPGREELEKQLEKMRERLEVQTRLVEIYRRHLYSLAEAVIDGTIGLASAGRHAKQLALGEVQLSGEGGE